MTINIGAKAGLSGHFSIVAHGGKRGRVKLAEFDNMILDAGLNRLFTETSVLNYCHLGTGATVVSAGQTTLAAKAATTGTVQRNFAASGSYVVGPPAYKEDFKTWRFATGVAVGNFTEVGVGWDSTGSLFSRALIVDGAGNPTAITVLTDEQLDVTYTLRIYAPAVDVTGSITLEGNSYDYVMRASNMSSSGGGGWNPQVLSVYGLWAGAAGSTASTYSGAINPSVGGSPSTSSGTPATTMTPAAYAPGSFQRSVEFRFDLNDGNAAGGIKSIEFRPGNIFGQAYTVSFQTQFTPSIPKTAAKVLKLNVVFSLARA